MSEHAMPSVEETIGQELNITRVFDAPRELVYQVWTDPRHVTQWWGPHHFTNAVCELDARPGGSIRIHMQAPDGTIYPMTGIYQELVQPERIVFTSEALDSEGNALFQVLTTVTFTEQDGKTTQSFNARVLTATPAALQFIKGMEEGWNQSLERFESYLAVVRNAEKNEPTADTSDREIVIRREIDAPRDLVFTAWTDSSHLSHWWGPTGFTTTTHEMEFRPGGTWRFIMHGPNGVDYPNLISYREIVRPERIAYLHGTGEENDPHQFQVTVTFDDLGGRTMLTMRSLFATAEVREMVTREYKAVEGGNQTIDRLRNYVAGM